MIELNGKYGTAKVFTDNIEQEAISQVINLLNQPFVKDCKIRLQPDCHAGKGCVIGFTAELGDKAIPNLVGVDIGCGMHVTNLGQGEIDLENLDKIIRNETKFGMEVYDEAKVDFSSELKTLYCYNKLRNVQRIENSIGSLGGGNHFIEVGVDSKGNKWIVIHTGSRNLGKQVAEIYQAMAIEDCSDNGAMENEINESIALLKSEGKSKMIQNTLKGIKEKYSKIKPNYPEELCFLQGEHMDMYLHDMKICQKYASLNRTILADTILKSLYNKSTKDFISFETIHNYINFKDKILRKGAISANKGETVLIPMNMRDGSLLCVGKGNKDWNCSAPHGAGRIMSRGNAKRSISLEAYKESMKDVYSSCINESTIDESPFAYKPMQEIIDNIGDTVEILEIIKPIYNFKASE